MIEIVFILMGIISLIILLTIAGINIGTANSKKFKRLYEFTQNNIYCAIIIIINFICFIIGVFGTFGTAVKSEYNQSMDYYIAQLEIKKDITYQLKLYENDIEALKNADVVKIDFVLKDTLINLSKTIKNYNKNIYKQRSYKNSFWFSNYYNKDVAALEPIEFW